MNHSAESHGGGHRELLTASRRTVMLLHCLTGCAIGEVLGMVLATAFVLGNRRLDRDLRRLSPSCSATR